MKSHAFFRVSAWLFLLIHTVQRISARLLNITVDDSNPDPITGNTFLYSPANDWNTGNNCSQCDAKLDSSKIYLSTWHDTTYQPEGPFDREHVVQTALFQFNGSAIHVFGILSLSLDTPMGKSDLSFFIDGQLAGNFTYTPPGGDGIYVYNASLWSYQLPTDGAHSFMLQNGRAGGSPSLVLLDYIIYTREEDENTSSASVILQTPSTSLDTVTPTTVTPTTVTPTTVTPTTVQTVQPSPSQTLSPQTSAPLEKIHSRMSRTSIVAISVSGGLAVIALIIALYLLWRRKSMQHPTRTARSHEEPNGLITPFSLPGMIASSRQGFGKHTSPTQLTIPMDTPIASGTYDAQSAAWHPSQTGRRHPRPPAAGFRSYGHLTAKPFDSEDHDEEGSELPPRYDTVIPSNRACPS